jgi:uncharacterized protein (DUF362 family)
MMVKGLSIKFKDYEKTLPTLLKMIKFDVELKKHENVVLKPNLISGIREECTKAEFVEPILKFCMENKNPGTEIFIAEGSDGRDTREVFEELGYKDLSEKYGVGLIDLNKAEVEEIVNNDFLRFDEIMYPKILLNSFVISLPSLVVNSEGEISASLHNMLGAFPEKYYRGFFGFGKDKIKKFPLKYQIHDVIKCKMPEFAILDASEKGVILAGQAFEMDKQSARLMGLDWRSVEHLDLLNEEDPENEVED